MQTYAHTHWDKFTHIHTHTHTHTHTSVSGTALFYLLLHHSSLLLSDMQSRHQHGSCFSQHSSGARQEDVPPTSCQPGWCRALCSPWGEQISDSTSEPSVRDDDGCILQISAEASEEAEKELQLSAFGSNKRAHNLTRRNLRSWLSVCLCLFVYVCICVFLHLENSHGCMCPLPFLQCKYVSHTNGQMKGLTPYLHACRDSYVTNTPLWLNERADWNIK